MSWWSLYIKELRLTKTKFLLNMIFLVMVGILFYVLIERYNPLFLTLTIPLIILHLFYMFFAMIDTLRLEWKQRTSVFWLNIPKSGWYLLTAKFVATATQLFASLIGTSLIIYILLYRSTILMVDPEIPNFLLDQFQSFWWIFFFAIIIGSMQLGAISTFIYMMTKSIRKWGWLLGLFIAIGAAWLWGKFQETIIYKGITEWGAILNEQTLLESFLVDINGQPTVDTTTVGEAAIYVGSSVVDIIVVIFILFVSAWLLDNKVEA